MKRTGTTPAPSTTALSGAEASGATGPGAEACGSKVPETEAGALGPETVDVIVVGAGVSGCACASALAVGGARVMVVSSALDVVGLPGHGPAVAPASGQWREIVQVLSSLPEALCSAWLNAASILEDGIPLLIVDRRAVSIETKRALELIPGLQFRQGLVTDVRVIDSPGRGGPVGVEIETVFGEILAAPLVVLATGLAMGGVMRIGEQEMAGGQYGEVPATALEAALREAGVSFRETEVSVGARYGADSRFVTEALAAAGDQQLVAHAVPIRSLLRGSAGAAAEEAGEPLRTIVRCFADCMARVDEMEPAGLWPADFPPSPHWTESSEPVVAVISDVPPICPRAPAASPRGVIEAAGAQEGQKAPSTGSGAETVPLRVPVLLPDGVATQEFYVGHPAERGAGPGGDSMMVRPSVNTDCLAADVVNDAAEPAADAAADPAIDAGSEEPASRLEYTVRASVLSELEKEGRVLGFGGRVWAVGRVAGADDYLGSLRSGVIVGRGLLTLLRGGEESPPVEAARVARCAERRSVATVEGSWVAAEDERQVTKDEGC